MTSSKIFFGKRPLSVITVGDLEDYKSWWRRVHKVREVTIRHDLHALSVLFQYGQKHQGCNRNPIEDVEIPSDKQSVRIRVLRLLKNSRILPLVSRCGAKRRT